MKGPKSAMVLAAVAAAAFISTPGNAMPRPDMNVGPAIAGQGNLALANIKAEMKQAILFWTPRSPDPAVRTVSRKSGSQRVDGAGIASFAEAQCAP